MIKNKLKKGQEEMIGFALIVILVSIILLILISIIVMRGDKNKTVESYEVESFVQSILSYTTDCREDITNNHLSLQELIFKCMDNQKCIDGKNSCQVLNSTIKGIIQSSWDTSQTTTKGFEFKIMYGTGLISLKEGNSTGISRTAIQPLIKPGKNVNLSLEIYG